MLVLSRGENGKTVAVESGQRFAIELDSNPGTGYKWSWIIKPDPDLIKLEEEFHRPRCGSMLLIGGSGVDVWTFQAIKAGCTTLEIEYRRPWENKPPRARFSLHITIINNSSHNDA